MQEYVLILAYDWIREQIIFVEKNRPEIQKNRINLPGGKIEPGESPQEAAIREFHEECGIKIYAPILRGKITGDWGLIYCFSVDLEQPNNGNLIAIIPQETETERFFWHDPEYCRMNSQCMPNLRVIIPLIRSNVSNWTIIDNNPDLGHRPYNLQVLLED